MFVATNVSASGRNYNNAAPRGFRVHARVDNNSEGFNVSAVRWGGAGTRRGITTGDHNGSMTVTTTRAAARWSRQNDLPILFTRFSAVFRRRRSPNSSRERVIRNRIEKWRTRLTVASVNYSLRAIVDDSFRFYTFTIYEF